MNMPNQHGEPLLEALCLFMQVGHMREDVECGGLHRIVYADSHLILDEWVNAMSSGVSDRPTKRASSMMSSIVSIEVSFALVFYVIISSYIWAVVFSTVFPDSSDATSRTEKYPQRRKPQGKDLHGEFRGLRQNLSDVRQSLFAKGRSQRACDRLHEFAVSLRGTARSNPHA
ncbi:hypothetical protein [Caballeronia sp. LZ035]|uniref:hypothetical protein n=1 Tax=Caballeronia sp. LZ035 TaxID=3038568 RepID=UPI002864FE30|nr:hypothetical protein [Caballeronia sp. LZ035]MDR5761467.1 hypothetical protein [Caballeronia sp. LZ035]